MIGFYDSGIGGKIILKQLNNINPNLDTYYFADLKNCPLGEKTSIEIKNCVINGLNYLFEHGCNLVILACNTATVESIKFIQQEWLPNHYPNKNVLGIVRPVSEELNRRKYAKTSKIAILATKATVNSSFYNNDLLEFGYNNVIKISMQKLALLIENDEEEKAKELIFNIIFENKDKLIDTDIVVLACTHYPYLMDYFKKVFYEILGYCPFILSQDVLIAEQLIDYLQKHKLYSTFNNKHLFYVNESRALIEV
jgi:glutamate racemase